MLRRDTLERRLFRWLLAVALVPTLVTLIVAVALGARSLEWFGTLGPWSRVGESGRELIEAAGPAAREDSTLAATLDRHRSVLSESLIQARRWNFIGGRIARALPFVIVVAGLGLTVLALLVSRRLAHGLAKPIGELVDWSSRMARGEVLPAGDPSEAREVVEVRELRGALRSASVRIEEGRRRALDAERQRAWGEMARRVAHEMKNPLTPLRLAAHRLGRAGSSDAATVEAVAVIAEETERLEDLARQFAVLGRPSAGPPSEVDVVELLESLLASDVPAGIGAALAAAPGTSPIEAHYDALLRAFRNLIRNAVEAVQTSPMEGPAGTRAIAIDVAPWNEGGVRVAIADSGPGIPVGGSTRIFEADFTLKAGGTGLGLAVVRQAVAAHGGSIQAGRGALGGAEFVIHLPAHPPAGAQDTSRNG